MQRTGFGQPSGTLFEDIGDVFGAEGLILQGILNGPSYRLLAVDFAQRDDLADVDGRIQPPGFQLLVVVLGT